VMTVTSDLDFTTDQRNAIDAISEWVENGDDQVLTMGGYAGTGKTTLLGYLPELLPETRIIYATPTGKALSVLKGKLPENADIRTLHSLLYHPVIYSVCKSSGQLCKQGEVCDVHKTNKKPKSECQTEDRVSFKDKESRPVADLIIVDEASMVTEQVFEDLLKTRIPILAVGDHGQLPPVKDLFRLMESPDIRLEEIHRQAKDSPIIELSIMARTSGHIPVGDYGDGVKKLRRGPTPPDPREFDAIICGKNSTRVKINQLVRRVYGHEGDPKPGEPIICLRNFKHRGYFFHNGMLGRIVKVGRLVDSNMIFEGNETYKAWEAIIACPEMTDKKGNTLLIEVFMMQNQFNRTKTIQATNLPGSDKLPPTLWDYGYALTCHKMQGSQEEKVLVFEEKIYNTDYRKWLYTAVTRASKELVIIG
jgi:exodeoxyribonuclease V